MLTNFHENHNEFETRYEWLRPGQLRERQRECSLAFFPIAPLEYHGPHMPIGTDIINAAMVAHGACRELGRGVVRPALSLGTEREREPDVAQNLGFGEDDYVFGMDFSTRLWNSHYLQEEVFAAVLAGELELLIGQGYRNILICNGHGAVNHIETIKRLCKLYTHSTDCRVEWCIVVPFEDFEKNLIGHADISETSLLKYYKSDSIDLSTLPHEDQPLVYQQFSIVDGPGFTENHSPDRTVSAENDPRNATEELGKKLFEHTIKDVLTLLEEKFQIVKPSSSDEQKPLRVSG